MRTRWSAHEKGDTKKTNKDKTKKDEMLQNELANYKVLSYSQTEENEKKIEADMIVKSLPEFHLKNEVNDDNNEESNKDEKLWRYLGVQETFDDELELMARLKGYCWMKWKCWMG